jgi:hypothetical protein
MLSSSSTEPLLPSVKHALSFAKKKSWTSTTQKQDLSNIYCIAMGTI